MDQRVCVVSDKAGDGLVGLPWMLFRLLLETLGGDHFVIGLWMRWLFLLEVHYADLTLNVS